MVFMTPEISVECHQQVLSSENDFNVVMKFDFKEFLPIHLALLELLDLDYAVETSSWRFHQRDFSTADGVKLTRVNENEYALKKALFEYLPKEYANVCSDAGP